MGSKTTIKDLANEAGVSITTVSLILNGKGEKFSEKTRKKVLELQKKLKYVPNFNAKNLMTKDAKSIGILVPNIGNPFFSMFISGLQKAAIKNDFLPITFSAGNEPELESYYLRNMITRSMTGMVIASSAVTVDTVRETLKYNEIPYLLMDQTLLSEGDQIRTDDIEGGRLAANHLLKLGHKKIDVLLPENPSANHKLRINSFLSELRKAQINTQKYVQIINAPLSRKGGCLAANEIIKSEATAVFAINDEMALGLYAGLRKNGISIPEQISVLGYDDVDLDEFLNPPLTTIHQPIEQMGELAMKLLINRISNPEIEQQIIKLPVELVVRGSTTKPFDN